VPRPRERLPGSREPSHGGDPLPDALCARRCGSARFRQPAIMELELIEPSLYFPYDSQSPSDLPRVRSDDKRAGEREYWDLITKYDFVKAHG